MVGSVRQLPARVRATACVSDLVCLPQVGEQSRNFAVNLMLFNGVSKEGVEQAINILAAGASACFQ